MDLRVISKKSAEVIVSWDTSRITRKTHKQTKDRMLELGTTLKNLSKRKKKAETRKRTAYLRIGRKLKVEGERSLATIRRSDVISREMS